MTEISLHKAKTRGTSYNGWMYAKHTFCFADYYDPDRIRFGALRVINDTIIAPGKGMSEHPHSDIELILLTLNGPLFHKDSLGNEIELHGGSIQAISAGSGYSHAEINKNPNQSMHMLQFWIFPRQKKLHPSHKYKPFSFDKQSDELIALISPNETNGTISIQQDTWLYICQLNQEKNVTYTLNDKTNGVYILVLEGAIETENQQLESKDGIGIWNTESIHIKAKQTTQIVLIEVPMSIY